MALRSHWKPTYKDVIRVNQIKIIRLSQYNGWSESDISFLLDIPLIEGVQIVSDKVTDLRSIAQLKNIKLLSLTCRVKAGTGFDFSELPKLRSIFLLISP